MTSDERNKWLYDATVEWNVPGKGIYTVDRLVAEIRRLDAEAERLRRGDFTEEEFQNLCHNFDEADLERFGKGCEAYQRKLFGACWKEQRIKEDSCIIAGLAGKVADARDENERLRGACHSHVRREAEFRETIRELVEVLLANVARPLTVREAQLCRVCRICRCRAGVPCQCHGGDPGSFVMNYGEEFAHERCLKGGAA